MTSANSLNETNWTYSVWHMLRYRFITRILRKMASLRCRRLYFKYPIEKMAYNLFMKTGAYKLLRIKSILGDTNSA